MITKSKYYMLVSTIMYMHIQYSSNCAQFVFQEKNIFLAHVSAPINEKVYSNRS